MGHLLNLLEVLFLLCTHSQYQLSNPNNILIMQIEPTRETRDIQVQNKNKESEAFKRLNFLMKASRMFSQVNETYSRYLLYEFLQVGEKRVIRINKKVKRGYCKKCIAFMRGRVIRKYKKIRRVCSQCFYCRRVKPL